MLRTDLLSIIRSLNTVFTTVGFCNTEVLKVDKITSVYICTRPDIQKPCKMENAARDI